MADTWPVNNGAVGQRGSSDRLSSRLDSKGATPTSASSGDGLDAFGGAGANVNDDLTQSNTTTADTDARLGIDPRGVDQRGERAATSVEPAAANNNQSAKTYSGTTPAPAENFITARTSIENLLQNIVQQTADSFLQGLPGGLSSIIGGAVQGLLDQLPSVMNNLLNTTGLTSVLGDVVGSINNGIGNAINGMAGALADAGNALFTDLGNAINGIPGLGPVIQDFSGAVKGLGDTLSSAYKGLDPEFKAVVDGAIGNVGARILDKVGLPSINPTTAGLIAGTISYASNPANNIRAVAGTARTMDNKIFPKTGNNVFGNLAAKAELAAQEFEKVITTLDGNVFTLTNAPVNLVNEVRAVADRAIQDIIPEGARLFDGIIFGNERIKFINGKSYVVPR